MPRKLIRHHVYLIGVNHHLQFGCCDNEFTQIEFTKFYNFLLKEVNNRNILIIAEEISKDGKQFFCEPIAKTLPEKVAKELDLRYLPCDPDHEERSLLGIRDRDSIAHELGISERPDGKYSTGDQEKINKVAAPDDRKRELFWYEKIKSDLKLNNPIIFICGYGHTQFFKKLLQEKGFVVDAQDYTEAIMI